jgi:hypothetical protein
LDQVDRGYFDPLSLINAIDDPELLSFARQAAINFGRSSRYVYASLGLDVCSCSLIVIDHLVATWPERMKGSLPYDICDVEFGREAAIHLQEPKVCDDQEPYLGIKFDNGSRRRYSQDWNHL